MLAMLFPIAAVKVVSPCVDCSRVVGRDYGTGLAGLAAIAER